MRHRNLATIAFGITMLASSLANAMQIFVKPITFAVQYVPAGSGSPGYWVSLPNRRMPSLAFIIYDDGPPPVSEYYGTLSYTDASGAVTDYPLTCPEVMDPTGATVNDCGWTTTPGGTLNIVIAP